MCDYFTLFSCWFQKETFHELWHRLPVESCTIRRKWPVNEFRKKSPRHLTTPVWPNPDFHSLPNYPHIDSLRTLGVFRNFKFNLAPFWQGLKPFALNARVVDKGKLANLHGCLSFIKTFQLTNSPDLSHGHPLQLWISPPVPHWVHSHLTESVSFLLQLNIFPGQGFLPDLRRHFKLVSRVFPAGWALHSSMIWPKKRLSFRAGPGRSSGIFPFSSKKCQGSVT